MKKGQQLKAEMKIQENEKEKRDAKEKERLLRQLQEYAPYYNCLSLWDLEMVDIKVKNIPNEKDKREALKMQLNFQTEDYWGEV